MSAEPQRKILFVPCLYHDVDRHTVSLEPNYSGERGAHLFLFFSVNIDSYALTLGHQHVDRRTVTIEILGNWSNSNGSRIHYTLNPRAGGLRAELQRNLKFTRRSSRWKLSCTTLCHKSKAWQHSSVVAWIWATTVPTLSRCMAFIVLLIVVKENGHNIILVILLRSHN